MKHLPPMGKENITTKAWGGADSRIKISLKGGSPSGINPGKTGQKHYKQGDVKQTHCPPRGEGKKKKWTGNYRTSKHGWGDLV